MGKRRKKTERKCRKRKKGAREHDTEGGKYIKFLTSRESNIAKGTGLKKTNGSE